MTATADRFEPARSREELRLVELASGLLMLLDAHRLTGRLPLEIQVQASRLRHAVKLAVQAEAARTASGPPSPLPATGADPSAALRTWIAAQPWVQPGPVGWVYLTLFWSSTDHGGARGRVRWLGLGQVAVGPQLPGWAVLIVEVDLHGGPLQYTELGQLGQHQFPGRFQAGAGHQVGDVLHAATLATAFPNAELVVLQQFGEDVFKAVPKLQVLDRAPAIDRELDPQADVVALVHPDPPLPIAAAGRQCAVSPRRWLAELTTPRWLLFSDGLDAFCVMRPTGPGWRLTDQAGCSRQPLAVECSPRAAKRARLTAPASNFQSWVTRTSPRTRARRPPCRRRSRCASLRSTFGRVAR